MDPRRSTISLSDMLNPNTGRLTKEIVKPDSNLWWIFAIIVILSICAILYFILRPKPKPDLKNKN